MFQPIEIFFVFLQFGRKKKKYRGKAVGPASILKEVEDKESEGEEEDEDEDLSKYKLDEVTTLPSFPFILLELF